MKGAQQMGREREQQRVCQGRTKRTENHRNFGGRGGERGNSEKQTLASAILRDRGTQK